MGDSVSGSVWFSVSHLLSFFIIYFYVFYALLSIRSALLLIFMFFFLSLSFGKRFSAGHGFPRIYGMQ